MNHHYCYRVNQTRLHNGKLKKIATGLYKDHYEIHVCEDGVESPDSIPVLVLREIPWTERQRHDILRGTNIYVGFASGEKSYEVITDWNTVDGHLIVALPVVS